MPAIPILGSRKQEDQQFYRPRLYEILSQKKQNPIQTEQEQKEIGGGGQAEKQLLIHSSYDGDMNVW